MSKGLAILILSLTIQASADYRVHLLQITDNQTNTTRTVRSTLDHIQYPMLYPLQASEKIETIDSWKCRGNTSHYKILCSK